MTVGRPRRHLRETTSTNEHARALAAAGAPHGTLVTAGFQTAGRGRQGRTWTAPAGRALLLSLIVRELDPLLPLRAGLAVADLAGPGALVKWPNDVLLDGRKVAGVLVEARPQEGWAVVGIGVNAAVDPDDLPPELNAGTLGRRPGELEATLDELLGHLDRRLGRARRRHSRRAPHARRAARPPAVLAGRRGCRCGDRRERPAAGARYRRRAHARRRRGAPGRAANVNCGWVGKQDFTAVGWSGASSRRIPTITRPRPLCVDFPSHTEAKSTRTTGAAETLAALPSRS